MGVKILSLYDGMACGMIAMQLAGVEVESYDAYEIDKYAIKTAQHNFPMIKEHGDVFDADFTQYEGVDFLIGGSPCTYWSIAQTKNRETVASGMGWELFSQYVRALHEAKPKYFIYENNKSMSKQIRASIDDAFGFEAVLINSALVSAQNRQRLYWVGRRNADGTYSKVDVEQPEDRGILLKDVLDSAIKATGVEPASLSARELDYMVRDHQDQRWNFLNKPGEDEKSKCIVANISKGVPYNICAEPINTDANGKAFCVTSRYYKGFGNNPGKCLEKHRDSMAAEPLVTTKNGKSFAITANYVHMQDYPNDYATHTIEKSVKPLVAEPVCLRYERTEEAKRCRKAYEAHEIKHGYNELNELHPRPDGKTNTLTSVEKDNRVAEPINGYIVEFDDDGKPIKAIGKDGKEITIYEVCDGKITIKGKQYPIKLKDGYYIIRKLTVSECKRLQTVPEWYEFPVSNSQAYKMLGNGWTCEVIAHLIRSCMAEQWGGIDG